MTTRDISGQIGKRPPFSTPIYYAGSGLRQGCLKKKKTISTPLKLGQKWVFVNIPKSVLSGCKSGVLTHFNPLLHPKNPLFTDSWTHFSPLTKTHLKPALSGNKLFPKKKALRQPRPGITHLALPLRADFREGDVRTATFHFPDSGGSLNRPNLFTELPFL